MRKIIFLDIDGVLNSVKYDRLRTESDGNIDVTRLVLLKELVDYSNADIVLSSTWRKHWDPDADKCDAIGNELNETFRKFGLSIFGKTPYIGYCDRSVEIKAWLDAHTGVYDSFVILDDMLGGWGELAPFLVKTDSYIGRGLERSHIEKAKTILSKAG